MKLFNLIVCSMKKFKMVKKNNYEDAFIYICSKL
jgi:hypothetical protein